MRCRDFRALPVETCLWSCRLRFRRRAPDETASPSWLSRWLVVPDLVVICEREKGNGNRDGNRAEEKKRGELVVVADFATRLMHQDNAAV